MSEPTVALDALRQRHDNLTLEYPLHHWPANGEPWLPAGASMR